MCQLTFSNFSNNEINKKFFLHQSFLNSLKLNHDGFGFYNNNKIVKTKIPAFAITNLGNIIKDIKKGPILSHVRQATTSSSSNWKKLIEDEFAHPFESEKLILAHNGTLEEKKFVVTDDKIDSQIFLERLEKNYDGIEYFPKVLSKTMEEFYGKFAFLIYNKINNKFYVSRGETAKLYIFSCKELDGFVLNTDKENLEINLIYLSNLLQMEDKIGIEKIEENIEEISKNSIFEVKEDSLIKVGEIKENTKPTVIVPKGNYSKSYYEENSMFKGWDEKTDDIKEYDEVLLQIFDVMEKYKISLLYLDELIYETMGYSLPYCDRKDLKLFLDVVFTQTTGKIHKNIIKEWKLLCKNRIYDLGIHNDFKISFPYWLEKDIRKIRDARKNTNK